jgi:formylglycine-generating enzyme required for sulfatase activity
MVMDSRWAATHRAAVLLSLMACGTTATRSPHAQSTQTDPPVAAAPSARVQGAAPQDDPLRLDIGPTGLPLIHLADMGLWVGATEVSNAQFRAFRTDHTSNRFRRPHYIAAKLDLNLDLQPAVVTWDEAQAFCAWATQKTGRTVRLPTEAEWERFARAGTTTTWSFGDDAAQSPGFANLAGPETWALIIQGDPAYPQDDIAGADAFLGTAPVGSFQPNPWGLFDVHGNVSEWVSDSWVGDDGAAEEPGAHSHRGGSWAHGPGLAESGTRSYCFHDQHYDVLGLRVVVEALGAPQSGAPR